MENTENPRRHYPILERITAGLLLAVVAALGYIVLAAYFPSMTHWATVELQVAIILGLLALALVMVSIVALLHTR